MSGSDISPVHLICIERIILFHLLCSSREKEIAFTRDYFCITLMHLFLHADSLELLVKWIVRTKGYRSRSAMVNLLLVFLNCLVGKSRLRRISWGLECDSSLVTTDFSRTLLVSHLVLSSLHDGGFIRFIATKSNHISTAISHVYLVISLCALTRLKDTLSNNWYVFWWWCHDASVKSLKWFMIAWRRATSQFAKSHEKCGISQDYRISLFDVCCWSFELNFGCVSFTRRVNSEWHEFIAWAG